MTRIILCEGKTDVILLSYYLGQCQGWEFNRNPTKFKVKLHDIENQFIAHYKKDKEELCICSVGGKDNFISFYKEYVEKYIVDSENGELEFKLVIITDRDDRAVLDIEKQFNEGLSPHITKFKNQKWTDNSFINSFSQEGSLFVLGIIIPKEKQGALETLLMDSISEDTYDKNIVLKSKSFVKGISKDASKYIKTDRLLLKSELGVSFAILFPEKVFSLIDEQLKSIDWKKSTIINECFKELMNI